MWCWPAVTAGSSGRPISAMRAASISASGNLPMRPRFSILNPDVVLHSEFSASDAGRVEPAGRRHRRPASQVRARRTRTVAAARADDPARARPDEDQAAGLQRVRGQSQPPTRVRGRWTGRSARYWPCPATCFDALGGWDESYFLYSEEADLSLRARDAGFLTRYEPKAVATHIGGPVGPQRHHPRHADREQGAAVPAAPSGSSPPGAIPWALASELSRIPRGHAGSRPAVIALSSHAQAGDPALLRSPGAAMSESNCPGR